MMIKKFNEFVNEGMMSKLWRELDGTEIRKEEKEIHVDVNIEYVDEHHSFTDVNGVFHKNGYLILNKETNTLKKLIEKIIEFRGNECSLNDIDVSNLTSIKYMFSNRCFNNFNGDISGWNVSNITDFSFLFSGNEQFNGKNCSFNNWKLCTDKNKDVLMLDMFDGVQFDKDIDIGISNLDTSRVSNMSCLFSDSNFDGDLSSWNVSNCQNFFAMFAMSSFSGKNGSIRNWNFYNGDEIINFGYMFEESNFKDNISSWKISRGQKINCDEMFKKCNIKEEYKPKFAR